MQSNNLSGKHNKTLRKELAQNIKYSSDNQKLF